MADPSPHPEEREARIQRLLREFEATLRQQLPEPDQTLEQIEQQVVDLGRQLREIIERETLDAAGRGHVGPQAPCACGRAARFVRLTKRTLVTLNGERRLARAYYHCAACRRGFCPLDQRLQIGRDEHSVGVRALVARYASYLSERRAAVELAAVAGIVISPRSVQREAVAVGQAVAGEWAEREERLGAGRAPAPARRPLQAHVSMDGVMVPIGKEWKEAKVGEVYVTGTAGGVERIRYTATLSDSQRFGRRLRTVAQGEGVAYCRRLACLGDGAEWIWQEAAKHFPRSTEILDFYHLLGHLWEVARARYPAAAAAQAWMDTQVERLEKDQAGRVIRAVAAWEPATDEEADLRRRVTNYLRLHEHRLAYQTFQAQGFQIATGVAEASCKSVVQARLKGVGMRWSPAGAEAMLHLRAEWCSTDFTDFRAAARRATLTSQS